VCGVPMIAIVASVLRNERWPAPRVAHLNCPRCHCSYPDGVSLARHVVHQHDDVYVFRIEHDGGPRRRAA
jgi:hypothetical protein